jgi:fatty-acyl-CoA synthase
MTSGAAAPESRAMPDFSTIAEAVAEVGRFYPDNGFTFQDLAGHETTYSFPAIAAETARRAGALHRLGFRPGDRLALIATEPEHFVLTFLAALRIGVVPVPLYPPLYLAHLQAYLVQTEAIITSSAAKLVAMSATLRKSLAPLQRHGAGVEFVDLETRALGERDFTPSHVVPPDALAFIQYTSGSTTEPRGVMVTHRCLVGNVRAFVAALNAHGARDKGITWLPLYHDMGLIGFVLAPVYAGISIVFIPPMRFVRNANVWMDAMHAHRGTISFAPNFAFSLALRKAGAAGDAWDLSCVRALGCGAEPIQADTIRTFQHVFTEKYRLPPNCVVPAYGLAESTLAVTMKRLSDPLRVRRIDRARFEQCGQASVVRDGESDALEHVSCGVALLAHELSIMDGDGRRLADGTEGEICLRGPSVAAGYAGIPGGWDASTFRDGWLRTGDLGYLDEGELYVTGRLKDLIILNGRNIHPQAIEWLAGTVNGVRSGSVAAFSRPGSASEELVVVAETRGDRAAVVGNIELAIQHGMLVKPVDIVCVKPGSLPRTSSGKLRRYEIRRSYLSGAVQR